jgi:hypothetical protein
VSEALGGPPEGQRIPQAKYVFSFSPLLFAIIPRFHVKCIYMPIRPFLSDQPFDPEDIEEMSLAFESVCKALHLKMRDDPVTRVVAEKIIELKQHGVHGVSTLHAMVMQKLRFDQT